MKRVVGANGEVGTARWHVCMKLQRHNPSKQRDAFNMAPPLPHFTHNALHRELLQSSPAARHCCRLTPLRLRSQPPARPHKLPVQGKDLRPVDEVSEAKRGAARRHGGRDAGCEGGWRTVCAGRLRVVRRGGGRFQLRVTAAAAAAERMCG